jgi:hypothetical protein
MPSKHIHDVQIQDKTQLVKQFRSGILSQNIKESLSIFDLLQKHVSVNKLMSEIMDLWINFYLYDTSYLSIVFIHIMKVKSSTHTKAYVYCLLKYIVTELISYTYNKDIIKTSKDDILDLSNTMKLKDENFSVKTPDFKYFGELAHDECNLSVKALYVGFSNRNPEFIIKSLNTLFLGVDKYDIAEDLMTFLVHRQDLVYKYTIQIFHSLWQTKIMKDSNRLTILYYLYIINTGMLPPIDQSQHDQSKKMIESAKQTFKIDNESTKTVKQKKEEKAKKEQENIQAYTDQYRDGHGHGHGHGDGYEPRSIADKYKLSKKMETKIPNHEIRQKMHKKLNKEMKKIKYQAHKVENEIEEKKHNRHKTDIPHHFHSHSHNENTDNENDDKYHHLPEEKQITNKGQGTKGKGKEKKNEEKDMVIDDMKYLFQITTSNDNPLYQDEQRQLEMDVPLLRETKIINVH